MKTLILAFLSLCCSLSNAHSLGDVSSSESEIPSSVASAQSTEVVMFNSNPQEPITGLRFRNAGTGDVTISHVEVTTNERTLVVTPGNLGFGVTAGNAVGLIFSNYHPLIVTKIKFLVEGADESLDVSGVNSSGPIPGGFSAGN